MLARVLLKQEQTDEGRFWLHKALNAAEEKTSPYTPKSCASYSMSLLTAMKKRLNQLSPS